MNVKIDIMNLLRKITHRVAHLLGWNYGDIETWWTGEKLMVGFRCDGCGKLSGVHRAVKMRIVVKDV